LLQFTARSPSHAKWAQKDLYSSANARKAFSGQYQGLLDSSILAAKKTQEAELVQTLQKLGQADTASMTRYCLDEIAAIQKKFQDFYREYMLLEVGDAFDSVLFKIARDLVRQKVELGKPNGERLREYRDSNKASLELQLYSPAPIYPELEVAKLATSLTFMAEQLGAEHFLVQQVLEGKSPVQRAFELVQGSQLMDVDHRRTISRLKLSELHQLNSDSMIHLIKTLDSQARDLRRRYEETIEEPERQCYSVIANAKFAVYGTQLAPDATFTLRLAFGKVSGYEDGGKPVNYCTTFQGLYDRHQENGGTYPFDLPGRWLENRQKLELNTPFNFVSTADTIGGNSGSPVVNKAGELVGVNFDRNRYGLVRNFVYTDTQARHIAVHSEAIREALRKLYDVKPLLQELELELE
ncbi:MAG TPA: S46 family peptidase, partial [Gemmatales bacterium]|nr:S46 family peptidase [Gemmatales bacterium]